MATAVVVPPAIFVLHATKLRARKLERVAAEVEQELRLRIVPLKDQPRLPRKNLPTVLRQFRGKLR